MLAGLYGILALTAFCLAGAAAVPVITQQPEKRTVFEGTNHTFSVTVTGDAPWHYQWHHDGVTRSGATNATLTLTNILPSAAGLYTVVITNVEGAVTSAPAMLTVRGVNEPRYPAPQGGWAYLFSGDGVSADTAAALDGTWNRLNGSDAWDELGRGADIGAPGGIQSSNGILTIEDAVFSGNAPGDNRRFYFTRDLTQEGETTNAASLLNDGVTLTFRARLTPASDPLLELTNAPDGWVNNGGGKGMFSIRQSGSSGMIISFSLHNAIEDTSSTTSFNFTNAGLHLNNLNGNVRSVSVDPTSAGSLSVLPLDPAEYHDLWITIQDNGTDAGTHLVSIYVDGSKAPTVFNVTAGSGSDGPFGSYLGLGLGVTAQRGALDLDYFGYKPGVILPASFNDPVGITAPPTNVTLAAGYTASLSTSVTGAPPFFFQWYRDGAAISGATNATYVTPPVVPGDAGAEFTVVVSNACNVVTSTPPAVLSLLPPPQITAQPQSLNVTNGDDAAFSVTASSVAELSYQWHLDGHPIADATNATFNIAGASPSDAGGYTVVISNNGGPVTSEVAVLTVRTLDFGDAPASYGTLRASNGARHVVMPGVHLGAVIDYEVEGLPDPAALGDDAAGAADEDGVAFMSPIRAGQIATVEVFASTNGLLDAWMDCDANGGFSGAGEQIFTNVALVAGTNVLSFTVPGSAVPGSTFARFRFSTAGGLSFAGPAADGEVEDYAVIIVPVADLALATVASPNPVAVGSNLTFTITISNAGPSAASNVVLTNRLPSGATFVSVSPSQGGCNPSGAEIDCSLGSLVAGAVASVSVVVTPTAAGQATNTSLGSAAELDLNLGNNFSMAVVTVLEPPFITSQPQSLVITNGSTAMFSVMTEGAPPLQFQWRRNGSELADATNATLLLPAAQPGDEGSYSVRVFNVVGAIDSAPATLTVLVPPAIVTALHGLTNLAGSTAVVPVAVTGTAPLSYQWFFNQTNLLADATNATLLLTNLQPSQTGTYGVIAQNSAGLATGDVVNLSVIPVDFGNAPDPGFPTLLAGDGARHLIAPGVHLGANVDFEPDGTPGTTPADNDGVTFLGPLLAGQNVSLAIVASTPGRLDAWLDFDRNNSWGDTGEHIFDNVTLTAGTNLLNLPVPVGISFGPSAARFRFSTTGGLGYSGEAMDGEVEDYEVPLRPAVDLGVAVFAAPEPIRVGSNLIFSITVSNAGPSGASAVMLTNLLPAGVAFVSATPSQGGCVADGGTVHCDLGALPISGSVIIAVVAPVVTDGLLTNRVSVSSSENEVFLSNNTAASVRSAFFHPAIVLPPQNIIVTNGTPVTFSVMATGTALRYQWRRGAEEIAGATNDSFHITSAQTNDAGAYSVLITNEVGSVASPVASLTVRVLPAILEQPQNQSVVEGGTALFNVVAVGTAPLNFQWQFQNLDVPGATNASLSVSNAYQSEVGEYRVVVANDFGAAISEPAVLTVVMAPEIIGHPQSRTNLAGSTASFEAVVSGTLPLAYEWRFNGTNILSGQTNAVLLLTNVQVSQAGFYSVSSTNLGGSVSSDAAELTVMEVDFGDAPDLRGYPTALQFNGARHRLVPGVRLGAAADFEPDGAGNVAADGDDLAGAADEDGVVFVTPLRIAQAATFEVTASTNGFLDAWLDFNANGSWLEDEDRIFSSYVLTGGVNTLSFTVPPGAAVTNSFARFRFSTAGGLPDHGWADDGEVEDYAVTIDPAIDLVLYLRDAPDPVAAPGDVVYTLVVSNRGPSVATGVMLTNQFPTNAVFVSVESSQGVCALAGGQVECALDSLAAGTSAVVLVTAHLEIPGRYFATASAGAAEADILPGNNTAAQMSSAIVPATGFESIEPIPVADGDGSSPGRGTPYPSTITVSGLTGMIYQVTVSLRSLTHSFPDDLDVLLVGPDGRGVILLSDVGGAVSLPDASITLDDSAEFPLPNTGFLFSQPYRPSNYSGDDPDFFPAPAPAGPYAASLSVFNAADPNGVWSLYVVDDSPGDVGAVSGGWTIQISTIDPIADVAVLIDESSHPVAIGSNLTYTVTVTNRGPADATAVLFTNVLPSGGNILSVTLPGGCTNEDGVIHCDLGDLPAGAAAVTTFIIHASGFGTLTNMAFAGGNRLDIAPSNNAAITMTPMRTVVDVALTLEATSSSVLLEQPLGYFLTVTNPGSVDATDVRLINALPAGFIVTSATSTVGACSIEAGTLHCNFGVLAPGGGAIVEFTGTPTVAGTSTNTALLLADEVDFNGIDNLRSVVTTIVPYAGLAVGVSPATALASTLEGTNGYTLHVTNAGPAAVVVLLTNALPKESRLLSIVPSHGACVATGGVIICDLGVLPRDTVASVDFTVFWVAAGVFTNQAGLASDILDLHVDDNALEFTTDVSAPPPPVLTVQSDPPLASVDAGINYQISVSYPGPGFPTDVVLSNFLPAGVEFISASTSQGSCNHEAGVVVCELGTLDGAAPDISIVGVVRQSGVLTNATLLSGVPGVNGATQFTTVLAAGARFANETEIIIHDLAPATPQPSIIPVSGLTATVQRVTVTLSNLTHSFPDDLDIILVGPGGQAVILMSDAGGGTPVDGLTLSFDDISPLDLPDHSPLQAGVFRPANFETNVDAAAFPEAGVALSILQGTDPNGNWSLHVFDDEARDSGAVLQGWSLAIETLHPIADLALVALAHPEPVAVGSNLTLTVIVTNRGPATAQDVVLETPLPPQVNVVLLAAGQGGCTNDAGVIRCALGAVPPGGGVSVLLVLSPEATGLMTNHLVVSSGAVDLHPANNTSEVVFSAEMAPFIITPPLTQQVLEGTNVTLFVAAGGTEPLRYQWQCHGTNLSGATNAMLEFAPVSRDDNGLYRVRVENTAGGTSSEEVLLRVLVPPAISALSAITLDEDMASGELPFTVGDYETLAGALTVLRSSSNPEVVPLAGIILGGAEGSRTVQILPATNAFGSATITLEVIDGDNLSAITSFLVTVQPVNDPPMVEAIADVQTPEDAGTTVFFTLDDVETPAGALALSVSSSDTNLLPEANLQLGGEGTNRFISLLPATNQSGSVMVTVTATDADHADTIRTFIVTVEPVNDQPTLDVIPDVSLAEDSGPLTVHLTGITSGATNEVQTLAIYVASSDPAVLPEPVVNYQSPSSGASLVLAPATNISGVVTVTVTLDDGGETDFLRVRTFTVTITPVNDPPTISVLTNVTLLEDTTSATQTLVVGDVESPAANLELSVVSSDTNLVPSAGLAFSGTGAERTLTVMPAPDRHGTAFITVTVRDESGGTAETGFTLTVLPVNDPPELSSIAPQVTDEDVPAVVPFTIFDLETPAAELSLQILSSNTNLIPAEAILVSGTGSNLVATFSPRENHSGVTTVTLTCGDGTNSVSREFTITVVPVNDAPTLAALDDVTVSEDSGGHVVALGGIGTGASNELQILSITALSSNPALVPDPQISYLNPQGTGTLSFITLPGAAGSALVTVTIDDGGAANHGFSRTFTITVVEVNDPPALSHVPAQAMLEDAIHNVSFTVSDDTTPGAALAVSAFCSDTNIVPVGGLTPGGSGANRTLTIQPATNRFGSVTVILMIADTNGAATTHAFALSVLPVNDPPALSALADVTAAEDTNGVLVSFTVGDEETAPEALAATVISSNPVLLPPAGMVMGGVGGSRTLTLTPATNQSGAAVVTIRVHDSDGGSTSRSFTFTLAGENDPPVISSLPALVTDEDAPLSVAFTIGDAETPAGSLGITASSSNTNLLGAGGLTLGGAGAGRTLTMVPATNQFGTTTISLVVSDGVASVTNSFTLTVNAVNDAPTLGPIGNLTLNEDAGQQTVNLAGISSGAANELQALLITATSSDTNLVPNPIVNHIGSNPTGTLTFTPVPNASGSALVTVTVDDGAPSDRFTSRTFLVTVNTTNDRPFISDIPNQTMNEDAVLAVPFSIGDAEMPVHRLTLTATSTNTALLLVTNIFFDGSGANRMLFLRPSLNATGLTLVTITVGDGQTNASDAFLLTVNPVNDPPTLNPITNVALLVNFSNTDIPFNGIGTGAANESQTLSVTAVSSNTALVTINRTDYVAGATNGSVRLASPSNTGTGTAVVAVAVSDGITNITRSFTVFVWPTGNAMPVVSTIANQVTLEDTPTPAIPITVGDSVTPASLLTLSALCSNTNLVPAAGIVFGGAGSNRTVTITPAPDQSGVASISVFVRDTNFGMANRTFTLTVNPSNDLPQLSATGNQTILEDTALALPFTASDAETPAGALALSVNSSNPGLLPTNNIVLGGTGTNRLLSLHPVTNQFGSTLITLSATDGNGGSNSVSFTLTVTPVNDPPSLTPIASQMAAEDTATAPAVFTIGDAETPAGSLVLQADSSDPSLVPIGKITFGGSGASRTISILPATNQSGACVITLRVIDGDGAWVTNAFQMRVMPVNDAPALDALTNVTVTAAEARTVALTGISPGPANETQPLSITAVSSAPAVLPHPSVNYDGSGATAVLTLAPPAGASGTATVTVTVNDGQLLNNSITRDFVVTVGGLPAISDIADQVTDEDAPKVVVFTVGDAESSPGNLLIETASSNTNLLSGAGLVLGGTGANRTLTLTPEPDRSGVSVVTVTVSDESGNTASDTFHLVVHPLNDPPTLDGIADLVLGADEVARTVLLTGISSGATNEEQVLEVFASSSNPALIPAPLVNYQSPATTGSVVLAVSANASGTSVLELVVRDGEGASLTQFLNVTVLATNHPPVISQVPDQFTPVNVPLVVGIQVGDAETSSGSLAVSVQSSNPSLVPPEAIIQGGSDGNRALLISPAANQTGTVEIVVTVTDGGGAVASDTFTLFIHPPGQPPSLLSQPSSQTVAQGGTATFTVTATGSAPLLYQWERDGLGLPGATNATLIMPDAQAVQSGSYRVRVSNAQGSALSDAAVLRVLVPPVITTITSSGSLTEISFTTVSGLNYVVEHRDVVEGGVWTMLTTLPGIGGVVTAVDSSPVAVSRFYRVRVE